MTPTDTDALEAAFVAAIHAIVPSYPHESSRTWTRTPSERKNGRAVLAGTDLRSFDLVWRDVGPSHLWRGSGFEAYVADLRVATSYRAVPPQLLAHMIGRDGIDLRRKFLQLGDPTTPGLSHVEFLGVSDSDIDDAASAAVDHRFRVHWAQATD